MTSAPTENGKKVLTIVKYIEQKIATNVIGNIDTSHPYDDKDDIVEQAIGLIDHIPAADVVPVVRCRDCKHFMEYTREYVQTTEGADGDCYIKLINSEDKQYFACTYDDFCSYGERKEGGK